MKKLTHEEQVQEFQKVHKSNYLYLFEIKGNKIKIPIWCVKHELFFHMSPEKHKAGQNCPKCAKEIYRYKRVLDGEENIKVFKKVHNNKYIYKEVPGSSNEYFNVTCRDHR